MEKRKAIIFVGNFCNFDYFLLMFVTILARGHIGTGFYFKYAYLKEHFSIIRHQVISPLKHCIHKKILNFGRPYLLMPDRSRDNLIQIC